MGNAVGQRMTKRSSISGSGDPGWEMSGRIVTRRRGAARLLAWRGTVLAVRVRGGCTCRRCTALRGSSTSPRLSRLGKRARSRTPPAADARGSLARSARAARQRSPVVSCIVDDVRECRASSDLVLLFSLRTRTAYHKRWCSLLPLASALLRLVFAGFSRTVTLDYSLSVDYPMKTARSATLRYDLTVLNDADSWNVDAC